MFFLDNNYMIAYLLDHYENYRVISFFKYTILINKKYYKCSIALYHAVLFNSGKYCYILLFYRMEK